MQNRTVFLRGFGMNVNLDEFRHFCREYGPVETTTLKTPRPGAQALVSGLVKYQNVDDAARIVDLSTNRQLRHDGRRIYATYDRYSDNSSTTGTPNALRRPQDLPAPPAGAVSFGAITTSTSPAERLKFWMQLSSTIDPARLNFGDTLVLFSIPTSSTAYGAALDACKAVGRVTDLQEYAPARPDPLLKPYTTFIANFTSTGAVARALAPAGLPTTLPGVRGLRAVTRGAGDAVVARQCPYPRRNHPIPTPDQLKRTLYLPDISDFTDGDDEARNNKNIARFAGERIKAAFDSVFGNNAASFVTLCSDDVNSALAAAFVSLRGEVVSTVAAATAEAAWAGVASRTDAERMGWEGKIVYTPLGRRLRIERLLPSHEACLMSNAPPHPGEIVTVPSDRYWPQLQRFGNNIYKLN